MGKLMSQLMTLSKTDNDAFKELASQISADLTTQASSTSDTTESTMLTELAGKFSTAAETGSMDSLKPDGPPPPPPSSSQTSSASDGSQTSSSGQDGLSSAASIIASDLSSTSSNASTSFSSALSQASNAGSYLDQLIQELNKLQATNQDMYKELTETIAEDLATQAGQSTDPGESAMLSQMSATFNQASQTGSALTTQDATPPPPPPPPTTASQTQGQSDSDTESSQQYAGFLYNQSSNSLLTSLLMRDLSSSQLSALG
ncbi:hypothetical protein JCM15519_15710 [Fundidesulfovibrio butyratiphilus]